MPIYEYQCENCGKIAEFFQNIKDEPVQTCPDCQKDALKKIVSSTSFQLKGTGWYVTDIRDKNKPKPTDGESDSKKTAEKTSTSSAKEDKPTVAPKETAAAPSKAKEKPSD